MINLNESPPDIYGIPTVQEYCNPTVGSHLAKWQRSNTNFYFTIFLSLIGRESL